MTTLELGLLVTVALFGLSILLFFFRSAKQTAPTVEAEKIAGLETRLKEIETQWDNLYEEWRRVKGRYYREKRTEKEEQPTGLPDQLPPLTGSIEDYERSMNRRRLGI